MKKIVDDNMCYGCGVCENVCPQNCIRMEYDQYGFLHPIIDEASCIDCKLCQKRCIALSECTDIDILKDNKYIGINKDRNVQLNSSSGGAFTAIAESLGNGNTIFCGAKFNSQMMVVHGWTNDVKQLAQFRKSKYVQSKTDVIYKQIKEFLEAGKRVVFSGTPCQVAGLYASLGKSYEELFTIDLICTGVSSPGLFQKYVNMLQKKYRSDIVHIDMRHKVKKDGEWNIGDTEVKFKDGSTLRNKTTRLYRSLYGQKVSYRESCYQCKYACMNRQGDFTIGDWWGSLEKLEGVSEHNGISTLFFNSRKSQKFYNKLSEKMLLAPISDEELEKDNPTLSHPTLKTKRSRKFRNDYLVLNESKILNRYSKPEMKVYITWLVSRIIPKVIREKIKDVLLNK